MRNFRQITTLAALVFALVLAQGQVQSPIRDSAKKEVKALPKDLTIEKLPLDAAQQENPNKGAVNHTSIWLKKHRKDLYEVCRKAVKSDPASMKLLDQKIEGKEDTEAVDILTQFLDGFLK